MVSIVFCKSPASGTVIHSASVLVLYSLLQNICDQFLSIFFVVVLMEQIVIGLD